MGDYKDLDLGSVFPVRGLITSAWSSDIIWSVKDEPRPPSPGPTFDSYHREGERTGNWLSVEIRLVGSHPLWGHYLYTFSCRSGHVENLLIPMWKEDGTLPKPLRLTWMPTPNCIKTEMSLNLAPAVGYQGLSPL